MALQLMKLALEATTVVNVDPESTKYFYVTTTETAVGASLTIDAALFLDNTGNLVTTLRDASAANNYVNVYINGVLQMDGIYTYTAGSTGVGSLVVNVPVPTPPEEGSPILAGTPIIVEVVTIDSEGTNTTIKS
ncbi:DUF4183 domain-containing protein [Bacillus cereus]|uniref:DUF4183 domain-containing protein n=1 Tax=Bacillus cereus VD154 TaxID=1053238 RepID=A0A9W5KQD8_BACCE|nr:MULTISPECIES: DUF4183 domain-containing protein [Bacillus cereus group]MEB8734116.1 DUF4183 domain-containing protein [Bacillus cereus]EEM44467.1 hypothetical protein bthur0005_57670 [Bacillus thuringiensis serovar pakistani str. T13001]EJR59136.1 hypothetical protein IK5_06336 [Bacillus cereus VD154]MEB8751531.1 DUF4183 domain-containing protein [Bacillus cereus]MEB8762625.1 DUF4183 domain-containing protein [Bacillus cereus]